MDSSNMEIESSAETPPPPPPPPPPTESDTSNINHQMESAWILLSRARQLLSEGNPTLALQAVLSAIRSEGGEHAVLRAMSRAREMYRQRAQSDADASELTSLLAQCAIAEVSSNSGESTGQLGPMMRDPTAVLSNPEAILAESGRKQIIVDAFEDGSSFICLKCGGLFSGSRKDEHLANWCL